MTTLLMKGSLVVYACMFAGTARADSVAISVTGPINPPGGAQPFNYTQGSYIAGFAFKVKTPISITQLGSYDSNLAGTAETFHSAPVGVYDLSTNTLLVSATVVASGPATGFFRYVPITPLALNTTDVYAVVAVTLANYYTVGVQASSSPVNAAISYLSPAYFSSGTTTLQQPNDFTGGNIFGTPTPATVLNDFGANFQFAAPDPSLSYYFSDFAFAENWESTLTYINYSPQTITCTTNFYGDNGLPLAVPFAQGSVTTRTDVLAPGGSIHDPTTAPHTGSVVEGWAQATCTGRVQATMLFRQFNGGVPVAEAGVNAEAAPTTEFATFAQTATGIAYANPSTTQSATITFSVYNNAGVRLGSQSITLGPLAHGASNIGALLGLQSFTGFVKITSTIPIISLSLNFEAAPIFSSLPAGDLPSSTPLVTP